MEANSRQKSNGEIIVSESSPSTLTDSSCDVSAAAFISKLTDKITATFSNPNEDEDRELDRAVKRAQLRAAEAQEIYFLNLTNALSKP